MRALDGKPMTEPQIEPFDHFAKELDHVAECVADGKEPRTLGEMGLADVKIITAIERAAASGKTEKV